RVRMLDEKFPDVQQVLTLSLPSPELVGGPELAPELARIANDGMAGMTAKWPKKFPAFVASLPMNSVPAALEEMDRAIAKLGARRDPVGAARQPHRRRELRGRAQTHVEKADRVFPHVLRRHGARRLGIGAALRAGFLRRRPRGVRERLPLRSRGRADVHSRRH